MKSVVGRICGTDQYIIHDVGYDVHVHVTTYVRVRVVRVIHKHHNTKAN